MLLLLIFFLIVRLLCFNDVVTYDESTRFLWVEDDHCLLVFGALCCGWPVFLLFLKWLLGC